MKYLVLASIFLMAVYFHLVFHLFPNDWHFFQPMLIAVLLVYFNTDNPWLYYSFAIIAGLFIGSLSALFGLEALIYITILFILKSLQLTILSSKNIFSIIVLAVLSLFIYWGIYFGLSPLFSTKVQLLTTDTLNILKAAALNFVVFILVHTLYYNIWLRRHERQSI